VARILVVDDCADAAHTLRGLMTRWGHEARTARDGASALMEVSASRPDFVVLDLGLPGGLNGLQLAERLRRMPGRPPRLVAVTGWDRPGDRERAARAGIELYLLKPCDPDELRAILAEAAEPEPAT
jgi:CheY-like chemotaxis protein